MVFELTTDQLQARRFSLRNCYRDSSSQSPSTTRIAQTGWFKIVCSVTSDPVRKWVA